MKIYNCFTESRADPEFRMWPKSVKKHKNDGRIYDLTYSAAITVRTAGKMKRPGPHYIWISNSEFHKNRSGDRYSLTPRCCLRISMHSLLSNSWLSNYWTFQCLKMRTLVWNRNYTAAKTSQFADLLLITLAKRSTSHVHGNTALRSCSRRISPVSKYGVHLMVAASVLREFLSKIMYSWSWFTFLFWSLRKHSQRVRHDPVAPASRWTSHMQCLPMQRNFRLSNATDCNHTPELCLYQHWAAVVKEMKR